MNTDKLIIELRQVIDAHKDRDQPGLLTHDLIKVFKYHCPEQTGTNPLVSGSVLPTEDELKVRLDELPYTKHLDDGQRADSLA